MKDNRAFVEAHPQEYEDNELAQIDALLEKLQTAKVARHDSL
jgi:hypothetical protein